MSGFFYATQGNLLNTARKEQASSEKQYGAGFLRYMPLTEGTGWLR
jgi:hypothetical protein